MLDRILSEWIICYLRNNTLYKLHYNHLELLIYTNAYSILNQRQVKLKYFTLCSVRVKQKCQHFNQVSRHMAALVPISPCQPLSLVTRRKRRRKRRLTVVLLLNTALGVVVKVPHVTRYIPSFLLTSVK